MAEEQLKIYLLGEFSVLRSGEIVTSKEWHTRQARQLLKLLLTERGRTVPTERLIETLWPEGSENTAKTLRSAINALRAVLEPQRPAHAPSRFIITRYAGYSFTPADPAEVWIDVVEFECGLDEAQLQVESASREMREKLACTLDLYRGDYLREDLYETWATSERERLRERYLQGLERLANWQASAGDFSAAIESCRRALATDNCREPLYRAMMSYQAAAGDVAGALQTFERCRRTLDQELAADPSPQTLELHQVILNGSWATVLKGMGAGLEIHLPGQAEPAVEELTSQRQLDASSHPETSAPNPFIGREKELVWLNERLQQAQAGRGSVVTLVGEAGIGKTYLAQRLLEQARTRGLKVLMISCQAVEQTLPFAPLVTALNPFLRQISNKELGKLAPTLLAQVALLLTALRDRLPNLPAVPDTSSEENRSRLIEGLVGLFEELAGSCGLVIFFDDAHWADEGTLLLFNRLARAAGRDALLLLLAYRSEDLSENETLHTILRYLSRDRLAQPLLLQRFTPDEVARFVALQQDEPAVSAADLYQATQGNALFLAEALRTLTEDRHSPEPENFQPSFNLQPSARWLLRSPQIRDVVLARLVRLSRTERRVLELAATISRPFSPELLQVILPPEEWSALETLLQRRFIVEQSDGRLAFSHEVIREVVDTECAPLTRHLLHRKVAEGLARLYEGSSDPFAAEMAFHFKRAGAGSEADLLRYAVIAGDFSRRTFSFRHALTYYDDALLAAQKLGASQDETVRHWMGQAYQGRGLACEALLDWEGVKETYHRLSEWAERNGDPELAQSSERRIALIRALMGHLDEASSLMLGRTLLRSGEHVLPILNDLLYRIQAVLLPPNPNEGVPSSEFRVPSSKVIEANSSVANEQSVLKSYTSALSPQHSELGIRNSELVNWPPFCIAAPVPGQPWEELPRQLGETQAALLLFQYGWALVLQGRPEAEACLEAALEAAEETRQVACWVLSALQMSHLYFMRGDRATGESWLQRSLERGAQAPEADWSTIWPRIFQAYTLLTAGKVVEAREGFSRLQVELTTRPGFYSHRYSVEIGLGLVAWFSGNKAQAEILLEPALQDRTRLYGSTYVWALIALAWLRFNKGELEEARTLLRQSLTFSGRRSLLQDYAQSAIEMARLELRVGGDLRPVEKLLRQAADIASEACYKEIQRNVETMLHEIVQVQIT
jgi:DNA-binding SARP family transcriptional activator